MKGLTPSIPGVTLYNKYNYNGEKWWRTQIHNVHWVNSNDARVSQMGLSPNAKYFCRVFETSGIEDGRTYVDAKYFDPTENPDAWTLQAGDYVFEGFFDDPEPPTKQFKAHEVLGPADNRNSRLKRIRHWRIDLV